MTNVFKHFRSVSPARASVASGSGSRSFRPDARRLHPTTLPPDITDEELLAYIDGWVVLLAREDYRAAFNYTYHRREMRMTPALLRDLIKGHGTSDPRQRVTLKGSASQYSQRRRVSHWTKNSRDGLGDIWYDLNIDGFATDLTATFDLVETEQGIIIRLNDIRTM